MVETFGGVNNWGSLAQTEERKKRKKLVGKFCIHPRISDLKKKVKNTFKQLINL